MRVEVIGTLSVEDLTLWRMSRARMETIEKTRVAGYSKEDIERVYLDCYRLSGELCVRYEIDDSKKWVISQYTGIIYYEDE